MSKKYFVLNNIDDVFNSDFIFTDDTYFVAFLISSLYVGLISDNKFITYDNKPIKTEQIRDLRVFNEKNELHLWYENNSIKARLWINDNSENIIEKEQVLWGTIAEKMDNYPGFLKIKEDRGFFYFVPEKILNGKSLDTNKNRLKILTHSEIGYTDLNQATLVDYKYVKFIL